jgi:hypothetical protein
MPFNNFSILIVLFVKHNLEIGRAFLIHQGITLITFAPWKYLQS